MVDTAVRIRRAGEAKLELGAGVLGVDPGVVEKHGVNAYLRLRLIQLLDHALGVRDDGPGSRDTDAVRRIIDREVAADGMLRQVFHDLIGAQVPNRDDRSL